MMEDAKQKQNPIVEKMMEDLSDKLKKVGRMTPNWCIYRVPKMLRQVNPDAYTPHLISIGPFHHGNKPSLADMDEHKWRYTLSLLRRVGQGEWHTPLKSCISAILHAETEIKDTYAATINHKELAKMLLLDACFILELFFRYSERELSEKVQNDPVFQSEWMLSTLRRDLALLENQIPFFLLQRLFYMVVEHNASLRADYLPRMAFNFFFESEERLIPFPVAEAGGGSRIHECKHLLDLLLKCHLPWPPRSRPRPSGHLVTSATRKVGGVTIPNVHSMVQTGGSIKKIETNNLFDIKFAKGVLQIPTLHIHEWTDSLFRNLIAYEHCSPNDSHTKGGQYMVSYIVLMDRLINNREDVELLEREGIITVELGGSEDVTNFFKDICRQVIVKEFYFQDLCEKVQDHYQSRLRKNWRDFKQAYLKNDWTIVALIAAVILLVCALIQTVNSFKNNVIVVQ